MTDDFSVDFGAETLDALIAREGMATRFTAMTDTLAAFADGFRADLPGFAVRADERMDIAELTLAADQIIAGFDDLLVFGTGGSSLGAQAAIQMARYRPSTGVRVHFPDSLDPYEMDRLFIGLDPARTHILGISKSGTTAETLIQVLTAKAWLLSAIAPDALGRHFTFITEPGDRHLRSFAKSLNSPILDHPTDVGGRFSVLTCVGMLPVMVAGLDVEAFRAGATAVRDQTLTDIAASDAGRGAALMQTLTLERGVNQTLIMPYADALREFTRWHGQLWAESLGKDGLGSTPLRAVGPVDQHSQLQLFLDGPNDKLVTLLSLPSFGVGPRVDSDEARAYGLDYMASRTVGDTVSCQSRATAETLRKKGRIVRHFALQRLDERTLGGLFMHYMLETVFTAHLMGINAYDQPAVEDGKILTREYLNALSD